MRILIAEDDLASRKFLSKFLAEFGQCDLVVDGMEALEALLLSLQESKPYDLVCLDIMMPKVDGVKVLKALRDFETRRGILPGQRAKVIMTTALAESQYVQNAFAIGCEAYAAKPIDLAKFRDLLVELGLIPEK